ncbi:hypothetical protein ABIC09_003414 [Bradyrhizobium sp. S3.12.5]|uniref:hypothetical protein n=1 Tax=Bradyrhizobium sp. S3.12.5 TaxID=3156386 RepID=UPI00339A0610
MALTSYSTGMVTVAANGTTVTGSGTIWSGVNARPGDILQIGDFQTIITDVTDEAHLVIPPWGGGAQAGAAYTIWQWFPQRVAGAQVAQSVNDLIAKLGTDGLLWYLPPGYTTPSGGAGLPSLTADDGQGVLKIDTGALWVMQGGAWVTAGTYKGYQYKGAYDPATSYVINDVLTSDGTAYLVIAPTTGHAPPNATYYDVFASKGDKGDKGDTGATGAGYGGTSTTSLTIGTGSKVFTTQAGLAYTNGARVRASSAANTSNWMEGVATYSGTTLTIAVDKTNGSGTLADWNFNVAGQPGAGDLSSANNLSELIGTAATARANIYASPFDALAYNGMQINGACAVSQANGASAVSGSTYVVDGWQLFTSGPQVVSAAQVTDAPTGLTNSIKLTVSTANAAPASAHAVLFLQTIEGYRVARLAFGTAGAQPVSIGFWTKIHSTGTYSGSVRNGAVNRSYPFTFTQNAADTWEFKTVTVPGDVVGTWAADNTAGLTVIFAVMVGSSTVGAAGSWAAANYFGATGTTNGVAATTDVFQITGLIILPGIELPSASRAPFIMRPFDQELLLCRRYFYNGVPPLRGIVSTTTNFQRLGCPHHVQMRAPPTVTMTSAIQVLAAALVTTVSSINPAGITTIDKLVFDATVPSVSGAVAGQAVAVIEAGNLNVDARL